MRVLNTVLMEVALARQLKHFGLVICMSLLLVASGASGADKCTLDRLKASADHAKCRLGEELKNLKKGSTLSLGIEKCDAKRDRKFAKAAKRAEARGEVCPADDTEAIRQSSFLPVKNNKSPRPDKYDTLETMLRSVPQNGRIMLLRTYLPMEGRRALPLPTVRRVVNGVPEAPLPPCPVTAVIDDNEVDFSPVAQLLASGAGDTIDFIVELARALRIPVETGSYPYCAWWGFVDERFFNVIFPDSTATYFVQPFLAPLRSETNVSYRLEGQFVQERYKSFALYDTNFNPYEYFVSGNDVFPIDSTLTDFRIKPKTGKNPFQEQAAFPDEYGTFQVDIKVAPTEAETQLPGVNILPFYPNEDDFPGEDAKYTRAEGPGVPMPVPCNFVGSNFPCPLEGMFQVANPALETGVVSNTSNVYIPTITRQLTIPLLQRPLFMPDPAIVIRGRIPNTPGTQNPPNEDNCPFNLRTSRDACYCERNPDGCLPVPWTENGPVDPSSPFQLRYWSICNSIYVRPYPTIGNILLKNKFRENTGCVPDTDIIQTDQDGNVDPNGGWFTVVISTEAGMPEIFKPQNGGVRNTTVGANWVQGVEGVRTLINLRNMLPDIDFAQAGQNISADSAWQSAFLTMEDYYPVISGTCTKTRIDSQGWGGCVAPRVAADTCGGLSTCGASDGGTVGLEGIVSPGVGP